jgi:hypothetical protein
MKLNLCRHADAPLLPAITPLPAGGRGIALAQTEKTIHLNLLKHKL